ncbi:MAG TPA: alpha/beta hydrolase domain-containing protein [Acidimicrobiales bacterium]|nr:alpha/beta hydrolase domain-containing protein [Acidimicrobiales bacterium]
MTSDETTDRGHSGRHGHWHIARGFSAALCLSVVLVACGGSPRSAASASSGGSISTSTSHALSGVTVTGPLPVGSPTFNSTLYGTSFNLSKVGYEKSQFFVSGSAHSYAPAEPLTSDGKWAVAASASAPYKTRIAVYRPINPKKFNGTVVVEWLNVSGGTDDSPDWTLSHNELIRDGFAWVGVSAQQVGVNSAKTTDPAEYSSLSHPGDSFSYDIFSQAGQTVRKDSARILGGLRPHTVIAAGESQSAGRLMTYIDAIQPISHVYQGFLVHSQFGTGAPLSQAPQTNYAAPTPTTIRSDIGVPVLEFETETDVDNSNLTDRLHYGNPKWFRLWEIAGSSHYDYYGLAIGPNDTGNGEGAVKNLAAMQNPTRTPVGGFSCTVPINTGGTHWALDAAMYWLNRWVVTGTPPPRGPLLATTHVSPVVYTLDANGNVIGGVRTPQVDAPIAALGSQGNSGGFCILFGSTVPYSSAHLASLYKTHGQFVAAWARAVRTDRAIGFLLPADAAELLHSAVVSEVARPGG